MKKTLIILTIFYSIFSFSQKVKLIDHVTGKPVDNVAVFNQNKNNACLSDSSGYIDLSNFNKNDTLTIQHPTYERMNLSYTEFKNKKTIELYKRMILMDEFVISASRTKENKKEVSYEIDVIHSTELKEQTSSTSAEILESTGNIMVQKTQGGGGSPILRGFEANKVLLAIDGVRLNNAIYRSGHLQNSITIDNFILDRVEIIYGPSSVIYGSDALGGVIHYYTKNPIFPDSTKFKSNGDAYIKYSSADNGMIGHFNIAYAGKKIGGLTSVTHKTINDLKVGANRMPSYEDWGKTPYSIEAINGIDSTVANPNQNIQIGTGYSQTDFLQKIIYKPSRHIDVIANIQYSTSSNINRYDKLNQMKDGNLKYAEYYYGPQNRLLGVLTTKLDKESFLFSNINMNFSYQKIDEDRISRKFRNDEKLNQEEDVNIYGFSIDTRKNIKKGHLNYGIESYYNIVKSNAFYNNINTGIETIAQTRYPDGGSQYSNYAAYSSIKYNLSKKVYLLGGFRYSYINAISKFDNKNFIDLPYDKISISNGAPTGSISTIYYPKTDIKIALIASTGFRAPNVDDYGKIRAKDDLITLPNDKLKPEYLYNLEANIDKTIDGYIKVGGTFYYSYLTNAIVRGYSNLNGVDTILYNGDYYHIISNFNTDEAYIYGANFYISSDLNSEWSFYSKLNFTIGENITKNEPLGHIPPFFGKSSIKYSANKLTNELFFNYSGWKKIEDMSPFGEDNEVQATEDGFPGWYTINYKINYSINKHLFLQFSVNNILDKYYKNFASAVGAPGRNFIVSLRASF